MQRWASAAAEEQPGTRIQVTGGGSGTGLAALENGSTDIALSSRSIAPEERARLVKRFGAPPVEVTVARDGVAFFVHAENPVQALTFEQLRAFFLGDRTRWSDAGGPDRLVVLYTRENSSGTSAFVRERLLGGEEFPPRAQPLPGTGAVVNAVSRERWGLGFGGAAFAKRVAVVAVIAGGRPVLPTAETVRDGSYPFARDLYFYLPAGAAPEAKAFVDFVLSPRAQAMARAAGFFPAR